VKFDGNTKAMQFKEMVDKLLEEYPMDLDNVSDYSEFASAIKDVMVQIGVKLTETGASLLKKMSEDIAEKNKKKYDA